MRKLLVPLTLILISSCAFAQNFKPAPSDKAVVYFVRASSLGFAINFSYFDKDKLIGRFNGPKYIRYECDPGEHLFWARSENRDFVQANLEAGKVYIIDVIPKMGGIKAGVKLEPVDPDNYKMKRILKLVSKQEPVAFSEEELKQTQDELADVIARGLERYSDLLSKEKPIKTLEAEMNYELSNQRSDSKATGN